MQDLPEASAARFACGLIAGMTAKLATHPLDVAKKRFQVCSLCLSLCVSEVLVLLSCYLHTLLLEAFKFNSSKS